MDFTIGFLAGSLVTGLIALKVVEKLMDNIAADMKDAGLWPKDPIK